MTQSMIEHERKYSVDQPKLLAFLRPHITKGSVITRIIRQWYIPESLRRDGILRVRQTIRGANDVESTELTIKVPTADPAIRNEFTFYAQSHFDVNQFVAVLGIDDNIIVKDRWDITRILFNSAERAVKEPPIAIIDFFSEDDGTVTAEMEVENPPVGWDPITLFPGIFLSDITSDMSKTNFARARKHSA